MRIGHNRKQIPIGEKETCSFFGLKKTPASGAIWTSKSDAYTDDFRIEIKETENESISVKNSVLDKIEKEANATGKTPLLLIRIKDRWLVVIDAELGFEKLMDEGYTISRFDKI